MRTILLLALDFILCGKGLVCDPTCAGAKLAKLDR